MNKRFLMLLYIIVMVPYLVISGIALFAYQSQVASFLNLVMMMLHAVYFVLPGLASLARKKDALPRKEIKK